MTSVSDFPPRHLVSDEDNPAAERNLSGQEPPSERDTSQSAPLALPAPQDSSSEDAPQYTLREDGAVLMDKLGPMVLNVDGTISRIHNWDTMSASEQERTVRVLGKRNAARKAALLAAANDKDAAASTHTSGR